MTNRDDFEAALARATEVIEMLGTKITICGRDEDNNILLNLHSTTEHYSFDQKAKLYDPESDPRKSWVDAIMLWKRDFSIKDACLAIFQRWGIDPNEHPERALSVVEEVRDLRYRRLGMMAHIINLLPAYEVGDE